MQSAFTGSFISFRPVFHHLIIGDVESDCCLPNGEMYFFNCVQCVKLKFWRITGNVPGDAVHAMLLPGGDLVADGGVMEAGSGPFISIPP